MGACFNISKSIWRHRAHENQRVSNCCVGWVLQEASVGISPESPKLKDNIQRIRSGKAQRKQSHCLLVITLLTSPFLNNMVIRHQSRGEIPPDLAHWDRSYQYGKKKESKSRRRHGNRSVSSRESNGSRHSGHRSRSSRSSSRNGSHSSRSSGSKGREQGRLSSRQTHRWRDDHRDERPMRSSSRRRDPRPASETHESPPYEYDEYNHVYPHLIEEPRSSSRQNRRWNDEALNDESQMRYRSGRPSSRIRGVKETFEPPYDYYDVQSDDYYLPREEPKSSSSGWKWWRKPNAPKVQSPVTSTSRYQPIPPSSDLSHISEISVPTAFDDRRAHVSERAPFYSKNNKTFDSGLTREESPCWLALAELFCTCPLLCIATPFIDSK